MNDTPTDEQLARAARTLGEQLREAGLTLVSAESCTGGWIAKLCTDHAGSSQWFERGFVTYSNEAKQSQLGVSAACLQRFGAVSGPTVLAMADGALANSRAQVSVAVSGIAGPDGGSDEKPLGTVWVAWRDLNASAIAREFHFDGDRDTIRRCALAAAFDGLSALLSER